MTRKSEFVVQGAYPYDRRSAPRWIVAQLVQERGRVVASGSHEELLRHSPPYRRIFARYEIDLPPLEAMQPV